MATSPDIRNYTVGKGKASFAPAATPTVFRQMGNLTTFEFTPSLTVLDHFSTQAGLKLKDKSVTTAVEGSLKITMEEWTPENLQLALLAVQSTNSAGEAELDILQLSSIDGVVKFQMTNIVGPRYQWVFNSVSFVPSSAITPLSDEWGNFETTGQVLANEAGKFGTVTRIGGEADENDSSS